MLSSEWKVIECEFEVVTGLDDTDKSVVCVLMRKSFFFAKII